MSDPNRPPLDIRLLTGIAALMAGMSGANRPLTLPEMLQRRDAVPTVPVQSSMPPSTAGLNFRESQADRARTSFITPQTAVHRVPFSALSGVHEGKYRRAGQTRNRTDELVGLMQPVIVSCCALGPEDDIKTSHIVDTLGHLANIMLHKPAEYKDLVAKLDHGKVWKMLEEDTLQNIRNSWTIEMFADLMLRCGMTEDMFSCLKQRDKHKVLANVTLHKLQDYFKDLQLEMQDRGFWLETTGGSTSFGVMPQHLDVWVTAMVLVYEKKTGMWPRRILLKHTVDAAQHYTKGGTRTEVALELVNEGAEGMRFIISAAKWVGSDSTFMLKDHYLKGVMGGLHSKLQFLGTWTLTADKIGKVAGKALHGFPEGGLRVVMVEAMDYANWGKMVDDEISATSTHFDVWDVDMTAAMIGQLIIQTNVKPGETLERLAQRTGHLVDTLMLLNPELEQFTPSQVVPMSQVNIIKDLPYNPSPASKKVTEFIPARFTTYCCRHSVIRTVAHLGNITADAAAEVDNLLPRAEKGKCLAALIRVLQEGSDQQKGLGKAVKAGSTGTTQASQTTLDFNQGDGQIADAILALGELACTTSFSLLPQNAPRSLKLQLLPRLWRKYHQFDTLQQQIQPLTPEQIAELAKLGKECLALYVLAIGASSMTPYCYIQFAHAAQISKQLAPLGLSIGMLKQERLERLQRAAKDVRTNFGGSKNVPRAVERQSKPESIQGFQQYEDVQGFIRQYMVAYFLLKLEYDDALRAAAGLTAARHTRKVWSNKKRYRLYQLFAAAGLHKGVGSRLTKTGRSTVGGSGGDSLPYTTTQLRQDYMARHGEALDDDDDTSLVQLFNTWAYRRHHAAKQPLEVPAPILLPPLIPKGMVMLAPHSSQIGHPIYMVPAYEPNDKGLPKRVTLLPGVEWVANLTKPQLEEELKHLGIPLPDTFDKEHVVARLQQYKIAEWTRMRGGIPDDVLQQRAAENQGIGQQPARTSYVAQRQRHGSRTSKRSAVVAAQNLCDNDQSGCESGDTE